MYCAAPSLLTGSGPGDGEPAEHPGTVSDTGMFAVVESVSFIFSSFLVFGGRRQLPAQGACQKEPRAARAQKAAVRKCPPYPHTHTHTHTAPPARAATNEQGQRASAAGQAREPLQYRGREEKTGLLRRRSTDDSSAPITSPHPPETERRQCS